MLTDMKESECSAQFDAESYPLSKKYKIRRRCGILILKIDFPAYPDRT